MAMWFDIILPTYNNRKELAQCLHALTQQTLGPDAYHIYICVDGSTDGTQAWLPDHIPTLPCAATVLQHPGGGNHGRNLTRNLPLPYLSAPFTLLLDADMLPDAYLLEAHLQVLQSERGACLSQGWAHFSQRKQNAWADYLSTRGRFRYAQGEEVPIQYLVTDNVALPTAWYVELGGQDPAMSRHYGGDDTELGWRLHTTYGARLINNPQAWASNDMDKSLKQVFAQHAEFGRHNLPYLQRKHPDFGAAFHSGALRGAGWRSKLLRWAINPVFRMLAKPLLHLPWPWLRRKAVRYCMVYAITRG